jgi:hypothetical protein
LELREEIEQSADALEKLFYKAADARDKAKGPEKTRLRRITKKIDAALSLMEHAEDESEGVGPNASPRNSDTAA